MKYYIADDGEYAQPLEDFKEELMEDDSEEIVLMELERNIGGDMWCEDDERFVTKGEDCGSQCSSYDPCNKKNGRCRALKNGFRITGKKFLLTKDELREVSINGETKLV